MAAANMVDDTSSDSSCDDDEKARLKEAAIDIIASPMIVSPQKTNEAATKVVTSSSHPVRKKADKPSLRPRDEAKFESELETTPEFRNFVAKKLSAVMDGRFEIDRRMVNLAETEHDVKTDPSKDCDFKLFATSIPGFEPEDVSRRKRRVETSSSSEGEDERLQSAAISGVSILENRDSWIQITRNERNADPKKVVKVDHLIGIKTSLKKKKKKKKRKNPEVNGNDKMDCDITSERVTMEAPLDSNASMESIGDTEDKHGVSMATQAGHKAKHKSDSVLNKS